MHQRSLPNLSHVVLLLITSMGITYASFVYQRPGQWLNLDGQVCQPGQQSMCYVPTRNAGFPLAYITNKIAVAGYAGLTDDFNFVLGAFLVDIIFYAIILWAGFLVFRNNFVPVRENDVPPE